jgi:Ca-activated chloride channel family protein
LKPSVIETGGVTIVKEKRKGIDELFSREAGTSINAAGKPPSRGGRTERVYLSDGIGYSGGHSCGKKRKPCPIPPPPPPYYPYGGSSNVNDEPFDGMFFKNYGVNPFVDTEDDHLSTFAIDVDDASFIMTRSYLERGYLPPEDAVRVEEFINHFDYEYEAPRRAPFEVYLEGAPSRFGRNCQMLRIGIKGKETDPQHRMPANLVFLVDVSGSMARENRLELVKEALRYLVAQLGRRDRVGIVIYDTHAREVMPPTSIRHRRDIYRAIDRLRPGGSTNLEHGLQLAYRMAERYFDEGRVNRIILCSDGVANVGVTGADELLRRIRRFAERGITLTAVGVGMGNHNDALLEQLGDKGNGHYAYVDDIRESKRIFVENLAGMLQVIARDVKIQVDFNPRVVRSYRLLGYENRDVKDHRFRDDREDGGEVGAGHEVTGLYEIKFYKQRPSGRLGTVSIRYKDPDGLEVDEIRQPIDTRIFKSRFEQSSPPFRLAAAAAEFAEILRKSYWAGGSPLCDVYEVARQVSCEWPSIEVTELMELIRKAERFQDELAEREW